MVGNITIPFQPKYDYDYPIFYLKSSEEYYFYINKAKELGYLEDFNESAYTLSLNGWKRISEMRKISSRPMQAFVAMWFNEELKPAWEKGFEAALSETGFNPIRIDLTEHNNKICDQIIAEIRRSGLLVADFTGQRGGVYFEVGFAMGLGIPVIWTCRANDIENLHFDTRQYNHISWENEEDLKEKLAHRIRATIPWAKQDEN